MYPSPVKPSPVKPDVRRRPDPYNPAREVAVRVLMKVFSGDGFAAPALDKFLQEANLPARDSGLATHIVYGTLRHALSLKTLLASKLSEDTHPKVLTLLMAGAFEKLYLGTPPHAVVSEYVNLAKGARFAPPALVNAVLRRLEPQEVKPAAEVPVWLADIYRSAYGDRADAVFADLLQPQPLWLTLSDAGLISLEEEGSIVIAGPQGVEQVELSRPLRATHAFQTGQAQPINPASMACVDALGDVAGKQVLDLAGGSGIKAAMLAVRGAKVTSVDVSEGRHRAARSNLKRLGLSAELITHDLTTSLDTTPAPFVLLDAPCSGSGTLRNHPEIKLRLTPQIVDEMATLQSQMLEQAAKLVEVGGTLVYSVCSVTPQEGQQVIAEFLNKHPEFGADTVPNIEVPQTAAGAGILTLPLSGIDGFFIARLHRHE